MIEAVQAKVIVSVFHQRCVGEFEGQYSMLFQNVLDFKVNTTNITGGLSFATPPWQHSHLRGADDGHDEPGIAAQSGQGLWVRRSERAVFVVWVFSSLRFLGQLCYGTVGAVCRCVPVTSCHILSIAEVMNFFQGQVGAWAHQHFRQWNEEFHHLTSTKTPKCHKANPAKVRRDIMSWRMFDDGIQGFPGQQGMNDARKSLHGRRLQLGQLYSRYSRQACTLNSPRNMWDLGAHYLVASSCIGEA